MSDTLSPHFAIDSSLPTGQLKADFGINSKNSLLSANGRFRLTMQIDANLVVYDQHNNNHAIWSSDTVGHSPGVANMQPDGNFVIYDSENMAIWSTETGNRPGSVLVMQNDGNLVLYQQHAWWASGTVTA